MREIGKLGLLSAAVVALGCGGGDRALVERSSDLERDMQLAASVGLELAASRNQVVSALETSNGTSVHKSPGVKRTPKAPPVIAAAPSVSNEPDADPVSSISEQPTVDLGVAPAPAENEEVGPGPMVSARPTPVAVSFPSDGGAGHGSSGSGDGSGVGTVIGTIGGVVIRGGGVEHDDCIRHPTGGRARPPRGVHGPFPRPATRRPPPAPIPVAGPGLPRH